MIRGTSIRRLLALLLLFATLGNQASGGVARYLCVCSGEAIVTFHQHCHGTEGEEGPVGHGPLGHRHEHEKEHDDDDSESDHLPHEPIADPDDLSQPDPPAKAPAAKATVLEQAPPSSAPARLLAPGDWASAPPPPRDLGPPPLALIVARAVVRLV